MRHQDFRQRRGIVAGWEGGRGVPLERFTQRRVSLFLHEGRLFLWWCGKPTWTTSVVVQGSYLNTCYLYVAYFLMFGTF